MKYELKTLKGLKRQMDIQVSPEEVQNAFHKSYQKAQKKATVPGYRKGKAPLNQVRHLYQGEVTKNTAMNLVEEFYPKALEQAEIQALPEPAIDLKSSLEENKGFTFSAIFEIFPVVNVDKDFIPSLSEPSIQVEEKAINQSMEGMRITGAQLKPVEEKRAIQWGDFVRVEMQKTGTSQKKLFDIDITKEAKDPLTLHLGQAIVGAFPGDKREISLPPMPGGEQNHEKLRLKNANLSLTILAIQKKILPDLNDSFAQKAGYKSLKDLRAFVHNFIKQHKQKEIQENMRKEVLQQLTAKYPLPLLPEAIVSAQEQTIISAFADHAKKEGMSIEDIKKNIAKQKKNFQKQAHFIVHSFFLLDNLSQKLNFTVSSQEVQLYLQKTEIEQPKNERDYSRIKDSLLQSKVIDYLINKALKK